MKILKFALVALLCTAVSFTQAQTLDEVVSKHIKAIGGEDVINNMKSIYIETVTNIMGSEVSGTTTILGGTGYKMEMEMNGSKIIQCFNSNGGWSINPMMGSTNPEPISEEEAAAGKLMLDIAGVLHNYKEKDFSASLAGTEKIGDLDAIKVEVTKDSISFFYYLDPATYYLIQTSVSNEVMGQEVTVITTYSDFKKLDNGFIMPFKTTIDMGMMTLESNVKKVEVNKPVDPSIFDLPASTSL